MYLYLYPLITGFTVLRQMTQTPRTFSHIYQQLHVYISLTNVKEIYMYIVVGSCWYCFTAIIGQFGIVLSKTWAIWHCAA